MPEIEIRNEAHWHELRAKHIGASEVAALFDCQPGYALSHYALWQVKAGRMDPPDVSGQRPEWGRRLERAIAAAAAEKEGWRIAKAGYWTHDRVAGMGCTPDFLTLGADGHPHGIVEVKNVDWLQHKRAWDGEPPLHILLQLQAQCACVGVKRGAVIALVGGNDLAIWPYEARPKLIAEMEARVTAFWQSIAEGKEPPIDGTESTARALAALYPHDDGIEEAVDLGADNELPLLCENYLLAVEIRRRGEIDEREYKSGILAKLAEHHRAFCQGFIVSASEIAASPDKTITAEMVGQVIKGRAGYRRLTVKETDDAADETA